MRRPAIVMIVMLPLLAGALWAADFWEKSKFPGWSAKDAQKMIGNSPWARPVEVPLGGGGAPGMAGKGGGKRGGGGASIPSAASGGGGGGGMDEGGMGGMGGMGGRGGGGMDAGSPPTTTVMIRWHTALPIKQAIAKLRFGDEVGTSQEAAQSLSRQEPHYIVGFSGLPPQMMRAKPDMLKERIALHIKGKEDLHPLTVQGDKDQKGRANVYCFFPREVAGKPAVSIEDKEVEVIMKLPQSQIKRKFKLKEMMYQGKLEL